ncbi:MAG: ABC transporter substrate-binding protein [Limnochordia bacterium]
MERLYTFHLRQGVKFHNGREFTAHDVKFLL